MSTTIQQPATVTDSAASLSTQDRASYFRTKLEAEWGPYDLHHALERKDERVIVIDTRDADSFAKEHIPGSVNIPTDQLAQRLNELPKDREVVPYCWSIVCHLATRAALFLSEKGYRVHELAGGIEYWKKYDLPIETGKK